MMSRPSSATSSWVAKRCCSWDSRRKECRSGGPCGASARCSASSNHRNDGSLIMRAREPDRTGHVERDGVTLYYEIYGSGQQSMVFLPPWSIVHSRVYKAQLPYF